MDVKLVQTVDDLNFETFKLCTEIRKIRRYY